MILKLRRIKYFHHLQSIFDILFGATSGGTVVSTIQKWCRMKYFSSATGDRKEKLALRYDSSINKTTVGIEITVLENCLNCQ
jgi:hypothetical protein